MEVSGKRAESVTEPCVPCQIKGKSTQADGYCRDCDENMCTTCFQNHATGKLCRDHVMSALDQGVLHGHDKSRSDENCKTHIKENIKYYCRNHDMVTCGDCNVTDHHGCKMEFMCNLAQQFENSSEFKDILKQIKRIEVDNNKSKSKIENSRKENKVFVHKVLSEIRKFRKEINDHLDKVEKGIVSEANKRSKENEDLISQLEKMISVVEQEIDEIRNTLDPTIIQGEKLFIRTKEYKPKLSKVDGNVSYIKTNNVLKCFTFEREKQLAGMIRSGIKLGCLRVVTALEEAQAVVQMTQQPIKPMNPVLKETVEKHFWAEQMFLPRDSRAAGFNVCSRVQDPTAKQIALSYSSMSTNVQDDDELQNMIIQIMDLTGCTQDQAQTALFDSKNDMDRAVNTLLVEGGTDDSGWREVGKKKKPHTESPPPTPEYREYLLSLKLDRRPRKMCYDRYNHGHNKDEMEDDDRTFRESWDYRQRPQIKNNSDLDFNRGRGRGRGFGRRGGRGSPLD